jgi:membrane protease subunit HflC
MNPRLNLLLILGVVAVVVIRMSVFTVDTREHAVKFRIGRIVEDNYAPGLHFKIPFFENVARYPNRVLIYDEDSRERFLTGEKKNLIVDYFVNWRVVDPAQYYRAVGADEDIAQQRLAAIIKEGIRVAIGRRTLQEVVSAERTELMEDMLLEVQERSPELGIQVLDVRVKRIDLAEEVSESVFRRMSQERVGVATQLRAEGEEEYVRTRAEAERERTVILAEAYRYA